MNRYRSDSKEYFRIEVKSKQDLSTASVSFAFSANDTGRGNELEWITAEWEDSNISPVNGIYKYIARILLNDSTSQTELTVGTWYAFVKITDMPEEAVKPVGQLEIY